jgi:predicted Abi (CAAX) family protease
VFLKGAIWLKGSICISFTIILLIYSSALVGLQQSLYHCSLSKQSLKTDEKSVLTIFPNPAFVKECLFKVLPRRSSMPLGVCEEH